MDETRERLAREMDQRRKKLRLRWPQVAQRASLSIQTLLRIRKGEVAVSDFAAEGIEQALEWPPGYVEGILSDGEPMPIERPDPADDELRAELFEQHRRDTANVSLEYADLQLEAAIRRINAERARNSSERSESA